MTFWAEVRDARQSNGRRLLTPTEREHLVEVVVQRDDNEPVLIRMIENLGILRMAESDLIDVRCVELRRTKESNHPRG